jgi:hypothetical protein
MTGYHTRWVRLPDQAEDPERIAIREALAFGKAVNDRRCAAAVSRHAAAVGNRVRCTAGHAPAGFRHEREQGISGSPGLADRW